MEDAVSDAQEPRQANHGGAPAQVRARTLKIVRFLREFTSVRSTVTRDLQDYEDYFWFDGVPRERGCHSAAWGAADDVSSDLWLQVTKREEPRLPKPTGELLDWVVLETLSDSSMDPLLRETIVRLHKDREAPDCDGVPVELRLEDHPHLRGDFERYVNTKWTPWSEFHRAWKSVQDAYSKLYAIHQSQAKRGEEFELVVGVGCLVWKTPHEQIVRRHLVTTKASLTFDSSRGVLSVGPPADGASLQLELEMLEADEAPSHPERVQAESLLADCESGPWDRATIEPLLKSLAHSIHEAGEYLGATSLSQRPERIPRVVFAPALMLRKRSTRGYLALLDEIRKQIEAGGDIPEGLEQIAGAAPRGHTDGGPRERPQSGEGEVFFPLAANEDQMAIVRKLRRQSGVHVQGPPGTGKSHTIANLICHLLALGKRVLITAQTPRALQVLHEKIPKEMQPLCVSLLGNDKNSFDHLQGCVGAIVGKFNQWQQSRGGVSDQYQERIRQNERFIADLRQKRRAATDRLRSLRERETVDRTVADGDYRGTGAAIAHRVNEEACGFEWLSDSVNPHSEPPLSDLEAQSLLIAVRTIRAASEVDLRAPLCSSESLREMLLALEPAFSAEREAEARLRDSAHDADPIMAGQAAALPPELSESLLSALDELERDLAQVLARRQEWVRMAVQDVLADNDTPWRSLRGVCGTPEQLRMAAQRRDSVRLSLPSSPDPIRICADAEDLRQHLEGGGSVGAWSFLNAIARRTKYLRDSVTVDGRAPTTAPVLKRLVEALNTDRAIEDTWRHWQEHVKKPEGTTLKVASVLSEHVESLDSVLRLQQRQVSVRRLLSGAPGLAEPEWHDPNSVRRLVATVRHAAAKRTLSETSAAIHRLLSPLRDLASRGVAHPTVLAALNALDQRDRAAAIRSVDDVARVEALRAVLDRMNDLSARLARSAPDTLKVLEINPENPEWDRRMSSFRSAWQHARARAWLEDTFGEAGEQDCETEIRRCTERIGQTMAQVAADRAWLRCLERMSDEHRRHFVAWSMAMKRIGKGTGKHAEKHRRDAQHNLAKCRDAIPAWIMPLHQVYDSVEPGPEIFDAIIVDEASQCGLDARILTYLTRQLIVVGDDKQISPQAVGLDHEAVFRLIREHLAEVPHSESFQPEHSLFDFAELWFGERIALREHFRCVPEIIRFSSDLCYSQKPLIPLRQYPPDRLRPLVARRVAGFRTGSGASTQNREEAEALVRAVVACSKDPRYEGKHFGVISLQGDRQAKLIEKQLLDALSPRVLQERRLICGDAYSFQGDERDVMFLSLVAAPNETIGALTKDSDVRRFNVAASRAKDQMWLFHSVDAGDLNQSCCRRLLVEYFSRQPNQMLGGWPIDSWREKALQRARRLGEQPDPFESWFELDVFLKLVDQGYRVTPQWEVAASRIDLMVEGLRARLAVECNGEFWHGPDRWERDQDRQRRLERAGLRFFTVWESAFRRDSGETLEPLWRELARMGIAPAVCTGVSGADMGGYVADDSTAGAPAVADSAAPPTPVPEAAPETVASPLEDEAPAPFAAAETGVSPDDSARDAPEALGDGGSEAQVERAEVLFLQGPLVLQAYRNWQPRRMPDPRSAHINELVKGLTEIIETEGPILCLRAYQLFARASDVMRIRSATRTRFNQAIQRGVEAGAFELSDGYGTQYQMNRFVRLKGTPSVVVRELGTRSIHDVPPDEVAAVIRSVKSQTVGLSREALIRRVLELYGLSRATEQTIAALDEAQSRLTENDAGFAK